MRIVFATEELRTEANTFRLLVEKYGEKKAHKIRQRLDEVCAASTLEDLNRLPAAQCEWHETTPHQVWACTIPPHHIIFNIARSFEADGQLTVYRWEKVTVLEIISLDGERA